MVSQHEADKERRLGKLFYINAALHRAKKLPKMQEIFPDPNKKKTSLNDWVKYIESKPSFEVDDTSEGE